MPKTRLHRRSNQKHVSEPEGFFSFSQQFFLRSLSLFLFTTKYDKEQEEPECCVTSPSGKAIQGSDILRSGASVWLCLGRCSVSRARKHVKNGKTVSLYVSSLKIVGKSILGKQGRFW